MIRTAHSYVSFSDADDLSVQSEVKTS